MGFWNTFILPYKGYILLAITLPYVGWVFSLDVSPWITWTLWFFNPYTWYFFVIVWVKRKELDGIIEMVAAWMKARRLYKEDPDEYVRLMTEEEQNTDIGTYDNKFSRSSVNKAANSGAKTKSDGGDKKQ